MWLSVLVAVILLEISWLGWSTGGTFIPPQPRILFLGDSLTQGLYATTEDATFVSLVAAEFGSDYVRAPGVHLGGIETQWQQNVDWGPHVVVIEVGLNDVAGSQNAPPEAGWSDRYAELVFQIKSTGADVVVCTMFWGGIMNSNPDYDKYLRYNDYIRGQDAILAELWDNTYGNTAYLSDPYTPSIYPPGYAGDNFHPSDGGHDAIADVIISAIIGNTIYLPITGNTIYLPIIAN